MELAILFRVISLCIFVAAICAHSHSSMDEISHEDENSSSPETSSSEGSLHSRMDEISHEDENSSSPETSSSEGSSHSRTDEISHEDENSSSSETSSSEGSSSSSQEENEILSTPEECARTCVNGEKPKTCYYHFTIEDYATMTRACKSCLPNSTRLTADCQCITADGVEISGIQVANRMYPGPSIMVCLNDYVVIDVKNKLHGEGVTLHWHGIFQNGYQYYDGVPYVTQCPIVEGMTFRYQWRAKNSGTHFWHSHAGFQKSNGLDGAIVVREPKNNEPFNELWDYDDFDNIIYLSDWLHDSAEAHFPGNFVRNPFQQPDNFLINGMGQWLDPTTGNFTETPLANFTVKKGFRYRFRMINSCTLICPVQLRIDGHKLTVIATDGEPIVPVTVDSITSFSAERYDFVLNADQAAADYWIQLRGLGECDDRKLQQFAVLRYESATQSTSELERPSFDTGFDAGIVLNQINAPCDGSVEAQNVVCVSQLESSKSVPEKILAEEPDVTIFFPYGFFFYALEDIFKPDTYKDFFVPIATQELTSFVGKNIVNGHQPLSLISQREEIPRDQFCTLENLPSRCDGQSLCECSVVEEIPLHSVVEIILVDEDTSPVSHPFHLHGASFYVMSDGNGEAYNITNMNIDSARELHKKGMMRKNSKRPPAKDTYAVYSNGFAVIRFIADNPGYWFFHCHFLFHILTGMSAVFHVGERSDLPPIPEGFPACRNFIPSIHDEF